MIINKNVLHCIRNTALAVLTVVGVASAQAGPAGTFSSLDTEFGGDGIPNNAVMISNESDVTLGITAHGRGHTSPVVTNDGAGTFFAGAGESDPGLSLWNYAFFIGGTGVSNFTYKLFYDFDPAAGNGGLGVIYNASFDLFLGHENSENLGFGFHATSVPTYITAPTYPSYDPFAPGVYSFGLQQLDGELLVASVGMDVVVGSPGATVPEPATMTLLATGLMGLAATRRRRRSKS